MEWPIAQIEWQGDRVKGIKPDYILPVEPLPEWEHGRKALLMADLWEQLQDDRPPGVLWIDHDVASDPDDLAAMVEATSRWPDAMHTGMVKLWPASTQLPDWIWSHRGGILDYPVASQDESVPIAYVATGFLWTPARLLDLTRPVMRLWRWEQVDVGLSELAWLHDITINGVRACRPKHLHF